MANEINALGTRGELASAVAAKLQDTSTSRRTIILSDIDEGYRQALRRFVWPQAIRFVETGLSIASAGAFFFLPKDVACLIRVVDATVPNALQEYAIADLVDHAFGFVSLSGIACQFAHSGDSGINLAINPATALEVLSSGTDVRTGIIEGTLGGQQKRTSFTLSSTTPVTLGSWDEVNRIYLASMSSSGGLTVTVRRTSDAVTAATIGPFERSSIYRRFRVWPVPQQTTTLKAIYKFTPPAILDESHEYTIPIQDFLLLFAWGRGLQQRREFSPGESLLAQAESTLLATYLESRGQRTEQYQPISPYVGFDAQWFVPALGW